MRAEEVRHRISTPLTTPVYPPRATRFTDREYLNVVYRTDPDALRAVVRNRWRSTSRWSASRS